MRTSAFLFTLIDIINPWSFSDLKLTYKLFSNLRIFVNLDFQELVTPSVLK